MICRRVDSFRLQTFIAKLTAHKHYGLDIEIYLCQCFNASIKLGQVNYEFS